MSKVILKAYSAFMYMDRILKHYGYKRFKAGEPAIAQSAQYSYEYASTILRARFPAGEPSIRKNQFYSEKYTNYLLSLKQDPQGSD